MNKIRPQIVQANKNVQVNFPLNSEGDKNIALIFVITK